VTAVTGCLENIRQTSLFLKSFGEWILLPSSGKGPTRLRPMNTGSSSLCSVETRRLEQTFDWETSRLEQTCVSETRGLEQTYVSETRGLEQTYVSETRGLEQTYVSETLF
jgi:hypothetical protein